MFLLPTHLGSNRAHVWLVTAVLVITAWAGLGLQATAQDGQAEIEEAFPNLTFDTIMDIQAAPDGSNRLFVLERDGRIVVFENDPSTSQKTTFLDIEASTVWEGGLLGLAFHPEYEQNGYFFVYYVPQEGDFRTRVSRFTVSSDDPNQAERESEQIVFELNQPFKNHNAGQLQFGPDGYLYVGLGDGGRNGDPLENGQDPTTLFGSMLRLDVDLDDGSGLEPDCGSGPQGSSGAYEIPPTNPFVDDEDKCSEIYAYGLRNPWRYSFGPAGRLWVGDVGEASREEINWVESGKNYGWDVMEGSQCHEPFSGCDTTGLELPIFEYSHSVGNSITGGYVYEGTCDPLQDQYIYGDYGTGRIWSLSYDSTGVTSNELLSNSSLSVVTFGTGPDDGLYFAGFQDDALYQFTCSTIPVELATFNGRVDGSDAKLTWQTASETNNAGFEVHTQTDKGGEWTQVGYVESKAQGGTTAEAKSYEYTVEDLSFGIHMFRLRQVDLDGSATLSDPVSVDVRMQETLMLEAPAPNPVSTGATLSFAVKEQVETKITLYNMLGQRLTTVYEGIPQAGEQQRVQIDASGLPSGTYFLRLEADGQARTQRLTVVQ